MKWPLKMAIIKETFVCMKYKMKFRWNSMNTWRKKMMNKNEIRWNKVDYSFFYILMKFIMNQRQNSPNFFSISFIANSSPFLRYFIKKIVAWVCNLWPDLWSVNGRIYGRNVVQTNKIFDLISSKIFYIKYYFHF